jgi:20S proteasome subunit beta 3
MSPKRQSLLIFALFAVSYGQQRQDPLTMSGGSVLAMAGKECVALAIDKRFGSGPQVNKKGRSLICLLLFVYPLNLHHFSLNHRSIFQMVNVAPRHVLTPHSNLMVAFTGLEGDIQSLSQELSIQISDRLQRGNLGFMSSSSPPSSSSSSSKRNRRVSPTSMASLTSHVLYSRRQAPYYVEPLVVGLVPKENVGKKKGLCPFLCSYDLLGAQSRSEAFICSGVATKSMYGTAEALWRPGLNEEELVKVCGQAFLSALERDCLSGYGAIIYLITKDGITEYDLACRND